MKPAVLSAARGPRLRAGVLFPFLLFTLALAAQSAGLSASVGLGLALFLAGLAHGAGEEEDGTIRPLGLPQATAYVVSALAIAGLFLALPLAGLALFLALSGWHFAHGDCGLARLSRFAMAGLAIGGSALFHPHPTTDTFSTVVEGSVPLAFTQVLAIAGVFGAGAALVSVARGRRDWPLALLALAATAVFHPVLAVGFVFFIGHALPIQLRQLGRYGSAAVAKAIAWPTGIAVAGAALMAASVAAGWMTLPIAAAFAFGFATPHMLTDRLRV
ncbi:Brp/Blh family beta-carotene 15,15'-dioxygenase [Tsuneonella amylolytica]|uniref:Brp/Blh family beta-carotene 15,15'-dioxygenase n=1 Tax=Tsuneonella amylolytica TaxID=2338327 RepID=UPI000EA84E7A|nr:Brp/Blh family beta-carotene 15,15'-dioxygenase [Tsuneonella amylolytica]